MGIENRNGNELEPHLQVNLFSPATRAWESLRKDILRIEKECFGEKSFSEEEFRTYFESPENIIALLERGEDLVGFSVGVPDEKVDQAIHIETTDITPQEQGKGSIGVLMQILEGEARRRGYKFITRRAAIENGYAGKIQKHYGDRIVESYERESKWGRQRYFMIRL